MIPSTQLSSTNTKADDSNALDLAGISNTSFAYLSKWYEIEFILCQVWIQLLLSLVGLVGLVRSVDASIISDVFPKCELTIDLITVKFSACVRVCERAQVCVVHTLIPCCSYWLYWSTKHWVRFLNAAIDLSVHHFLRSPFLSYCWPKIWTLIKKNHYQLYKMSNHLNLLDINFTSSINTKYPLIL